jgi:hypothetical protein
MTNKPTQEQIEVCFTTEEIEQVLKLKPKIYSNIKYKIWQKAQDEIFDEIDKIIKTYSVQNKNCHKKTKKFYKLFVSELVYLKQLIQGETKR